MKAVILAGGKGTRLGELTKTIPKPMIPLDGKPILQYQIDLLKRYGITDILILSNYLSEIIEDYFGDGSKFGVKISYFKEKQGLPLGTAGSLKAVQNKLKDDFLVLYGDVVMGVDLNRFINFHKNHNSACTLTLHPNNHPDSSDLVEVDPENHKITAFYPKPHDPNKFFRNLTNACLYILSPKIFDFIKKDKMQDFGKDIFPLSYNKIPTYGYITSEYLVDMGDPKRMQEVEADIKSGKVNQLNYQNQRPAIFIDRDGVLTKEIGHTHKTEDLQVLPEVVEAIKAINHTNYLAIVVTNQPVVARNLCTIDDLQEMHKKLETILGKEGAKIDCIYFCPHHPDKGYPEENPIYKIDCDCRKPKTGMINKAVKDFNIDLNNSYIIGDSWRDIDCGKTAGITTILVKTNGFELDSKGKPDYTFDNLNDAVKFIIKAKK